MLVARLIVFSLAFTSVFAWAEEEAIELAPVVVFGSGRDTLTKPLSPKKISKEKLQMQQITDVNRALKQTSGVYVREEDGQGLRPNIGLRGTNPDRSKKVVLMEDGILIGPAPYSAPAAYYSPNMNHVDSLEIMKGFQATEFGPNSVGGAVDYRSLLIPDQRKFDLVASYGSFSSWNGRAVAGGPTSYGGYLLYASRWTSQGFKKLDNGGETGFQKNDVLAKIRFSLPRAESLAHFLELRLGYTDELSNETYLGLTGDDFANSPNRRYTASMLDQMRWVHQKIQLQHSYQLNERDLVETAVYYHPFHRDWYRLDRFRDSNVNLRDIVNNPTGGNGDFYDILRGERDSTALGTNGELVMANNDRTYVSRGVQMRFSGFYGGESLLVEPVFFARYHQDQIERDHGSDRYEMLSRQMVKTAAARQTDTLNKEATSVVTLATHSDFTMGSWTLTPVARYETAVFDYENHLNTGNNRSRRDEVFVPGFAVAKKWGDSFSTRVSANEAVTLAGLSPTGEEVKESATNYEFELKYSNPENETEWEATFFLTDYRNLTGTCTLSGGCSGALQDAFFNGGRAKVQGLEAAAGKGFRWGSVYFPVQGQITLLKAIFDSNFSSQSPEWGVGTISAGDPLPYIPEVQYSLSLGSEWQKWKQEITLIYQSKVYDQSTPTDRKEISAYGIVDWAGEYRYSQRAALTAKVDNLFAREYAVSARPFGLRPGKPQAFQVGFRYAF